MNKKLDISYTALTEVVYWQKFRETTRSDAQSDCTSYNLTCTSLHSYCMS